PVAFENHQQPVDGALVEAQPLGEFEQRQIVVVCGERVQNRHGAVEDLNLVGGVLRLRQRHGLTIRYGFPTVYSRQRRWRRQARASRISRPWRQTSSWFASKSNSGGKPRPTSGWRRSPMQTASVGSSRS